MHDRDYVVVWDGAHCGKNADLLMPRADAVPEPVADAPPEPSGRARDRKSPPRQRAVRRMATVGATPV